MEDTMSSDVEMIFPALPCAACGTSGGQMKLPSARALRAFEATMRFGTFKAASNHLCVTPSALSKRILALEKELGYELFQRQSQGLMLTEAGRQYAMRLHLIPVTSGERLAK
jgi:hypothetical protein